MYVFNIHRKRLVDSEIVEMPAVSKGELSVRVMVTYYLRPLEPSQDGNSLNGRERIGLY